ncbi:MFS transporter [Oceanospirillum sediminis]|uniref:MFS transporter n=1 Tax=Oceanospirillum sediminis TaxID=2760088 RepID=A0A839INS6_9GAMM|nr:MFS transporter [Oceanospirillum sediminis]MBB1486162.1 MFS transporter [Oceanospirillum sediminis]
MQQAKSDHQLLITFAVLLVAINLRPAIAAIGPLADLIEAHTTLNASGIGLLSALPVFFMGTGALFVGLLRYIFGEKQGISIGILIIAVSCFGRHWMNNDSGLLITAICAGLGIAMVQALMPAFIKRHSGSNTGRMIGFYSAAIVAGAAVAAASTAKLAQYSNWISALSFWGYLALAGLALWLVMLNSIAHSEPEQSREVEEKIAYWKKQRSWSLLFFFGIGTGAFMLILAWLPPYYTSLGETQVFSGYLLAGFTLIELVTAFLISGLIHRYPDRRGPLVLSLTLVISGLACLIVAPLPLMWAAVGLSGVGIGLLFPLSLIITVDHIENPKQAGDLSAFVTGGGYLIASLAPFLAGIIRDQFSDLTQAWLAMGGGIVTLVFLAIRYSPDSYLSFRKQLNAD